jgi:hypothetical protein
VKPAPAPVKPAPAPVKPAPAQVKPAPKPPKKKGRSMDDETIEDDDAADY